MTPQHDKRVDAYIAKSAQFAQPILSHLRKVVHGACPEVQETMKWGMPYFDYKGMMCGMGAFKEHCTFGFHKGALIIKGADSKSTEAMGQFGRIASLKDLPSPTRIAAYVRAAMKLNDDGVKSPARKKLPAKKALSMPADFASALKRNKQARTTFDDFSPSQQREYIEWIVEAKGEDTRKRRLATSIEWLAAGKTRNWKYLPKK